MTSLLSNGTAPITATVLQQLQSKHPKRTNPIRWPNIPETSERRQNSSPLTDPHLHQPEPREESTGVTIEQSHHTNRSPAHQNLQTTTQNSHLDLEIYLCDEKDPEKIPFNSAKQNQKMSRLGFPPIPANKGYILKAAGYEKSNTLDTPWHTHNRHHPNVPTCSV